MPYLKLSYAAPAAIAPAELAATLTHLTVTLPGKRKALTVVALEQVAASHWFIGGEALGPGQSGAVLEVRVTEGTNTKAQKAAFVPGRLSMPWMPTWGRSSRPVT